MLDRKNMLDRKTVLANLLEEVKGGLTAEGLKGWMNAMVTILAGEATINESDKELNSSIARQALEELIFEEAAAIIVATKAQNQAFELLESISMARAEGGLSSPLNVSMVEAFNTKYPNSKLKMTKDMNGLFLEKLTSLMTREQNPISLKDFKDTLDTLIKAGFDPKHINRAGYQYNSLLKACIVNPTEANFEIFKYLIENKIVSIEEQLNAKTTTWDSQKPAPKDFEKFSIYSAKVAKFLDYIDSKTTVKQKNQSQLFNLSIFFNHVPLFEKLLNNEAIRMFAPGQRRTTPLTDIFMSDFRSEIRKKFIESDRFVEAETGALRDDAMMQLFQFAPLDVVELALQDNKLPSYSTFNEAVHVSLKHAVADPERNKAFIKVYNTVKIDTLKIMAMAGHSRLLSNTPPQWEKSAYNMLLFLNKPSAIDIILDSVGEAYNTKIKGSELSKLAYILECVRDLDGLHFTNIANKEHEVLLRSINNLSDRDVSRLALTLNIKDELEIKKFCDNLISLSGGTAQSGVTKLNGAMQALILEQQMSPATRFFTTLFTDPKKLFLPIKPIIPINPISYLNANTEVKENIIKTVGRKSAEAYKAQNTSDKGTEDSIKKSSEYASVYKVTGTKTLVKTSKRNIRPSEVQAIEEKSVQKETAQQQPAVPEAGQGEQWFAENNKKTLEILDNARKYKVMDAKKSSSGAHADKIRPAEEGAQEGIKKKMDDSSRSKYER